MARSYGLTRKITRKQALAYERSVPNGIGVTAIAAVMNAPGWTRRSARAVGGSYAQRYRRTRKLLGSAAGAAKEKPMKRRRKGSRRVSRRARPNRPPMVGSRAYTSGWERIFAKPIPKAKTRRKAAKKTKARRAKLPKFGRKYGRFTSLTASIGGRRQATFLYGGKGGRPKKIPLWAYLGAKSRSDLNRRVADDPRLAKRVVAAKKRRDAAAARLLKHGDAFTPNKSRMTVIPYETWSRNMEPNKRRKHRRRKAKANRRHRKTRHMRRNPVRRHRTRRVGGRRRRVKLVAWRKRPRVGKRKRRAVRKALHSRFGGTWFEANKKRRRKGRKRARSIVLAGNEGAAATPNRRRRGRRRRHYEANPRHYEANRRRKHGRRHHGFRHFRRNPDYTGQLKSALTVGGVVLGGFVIHRVATRLVNDYALSKVAALQTGSLANWKGLIGALITAGFAVPLAFKFGGAHAGQLAAGMGVSTLLVAAVNALTAVGQPGAVAYLSGYPDSGARAYGEYFMSPMTGYGEYVLEPSYSGYGGFGAAPMITQAAAGYGAPPMFTQAAAGYGAGGGAPAITQAAAGVGEYFMTGITGIGDYENVPAQGGQPAPYEGIMPDLASAERALTIAEAAAGVGDIPQVSIQQHWVPGTPSMGGFGDLPFQSIVEPTGVAVPVHDAPAGSRSGILAGRDGIFG